ncbi:hypothetical protein BVY03_01765 [bacterium K02(2017)]|nr:hypothetical protein BVY03_01765 [bacterium K02(2017)]
MYLNCLPMPVSSVLTGLRGSYKGTIHAPNKVYSLEELAELAISRPSQDSFSNQMMEDIDLFSPRDSSFHTFDMGALKPRDSFIFLHDLATSAMVHGTINNGKVGDEGWQVVSSTLTRYPELLKNEKLFKMPRTPLNQFGDFVTGIKLKNKNRQVEITLDYSTKSGTIKVTEDSKSVKMSFDYWGDFEDELQLVQVPDDVKNWGTIETNSFEFTFPFDKINSFVDMEGVSAKDALILSAAQLIAMTQYANSVTPLTLSSAKLFSKNEDPKVLEARIFDEDDDAVSEFDTNDINKHTVIKVSLDENDQHPQVKLVLNNPKGFPAMMEINPALIRQLSLIGALGVFSL